MRIVLTTLLVAGAVWAAPPRRQPPAPPPAPAAAPAPAPAIEPAPAPTTPAPAPAAVPAPAPVRVEVPASEKPRLSVLRLNAAAGIPTEAVDALYDTVVIEATRTGAFQVTSEKDLIVLLGQKREQALLGCNDEASSCMLELAQAVGARFVLSGTVAKLGESWQLSLQMMDTNKAIAVGRGTRIATSLENLRSQLPYLVADATGTPQPQPPSRVLPFSLMIGGGVAVAVGGVLFLQAFAREQQAVAELQLTNVTLKPNAYYLSEADAVRTLRLASGITAGVGIAAFVVGLILNPPADSVSRVALVPTFNGVALVGGFP